MTKYLEPAEILIIHSRIIEKTGGAHGVRDVGLFISLAHRPKTAVFGKEAFPGIWKKAAVYFESLAQYHVFVDGNKRTALAVSSRFLYMNGYVLAVSNKEMEKFALEVANKKHDLNAISSWLKKHSKKVKRK